MYSLEKNRFNPKRNKQITGTNGSSLILISTNNNALNLFQTTFLLLAFLKTFGTSWQHDFRTIQAYKYWRNKRYPTDYITTVHFGRNQFSSGMSKTRLSRYIERFPMTPSSAECEQWRRMNETFPLLDTGQAIHSKRSNICPIIKAIRKKTINSRLKPVLGFFGAKFL